MSEFLSETNELTILQHGNRKGWLRFHHDQQTHSVLYVGVSSNLTARVWEHKNKVHPKSFTAKYNCDKLVYYYFYPAIVEAIAG